MVKHPWRRLAAWSVDCVCILGWCAVVAAIGVPLYLSGALHQLDPLALNGVSAALVVVPVVIGLSAADSVTGGATLGKRLCRLAVENAPDGGRISFARALLRNSLKVALPWLIGHAAVIGVVSTGAGDPTPTATLLLVVAYVLPTVYVISLFVGSGTTLYDRAAATAVVLVSGRTADDSTRILG